MLLSSRLGHISRMRRFCGQLACLCVAIFFIPANSNLFARAQYQIHPASHANIDAIPSFPATAFQTVHLQPHLQSIPQAALSIEQLAAALTAAANNGYGAAQQAAAAAAAAAAHQPASQKDNSASSLQDSSASNVGPSSKSRSTRSIGDIFKRLFTSGKRSKQASATAANSGSSSRDLDSQSSAAIPSSAASSVQQQQQHQAAVAAAAAQSLQQQNQQAANLASFAAAAANQHAVYAPFAAANYGQHALYQPTFASYSPAAGALFAWPNLAQAIRPPTATLIATGAPQANGQPEPLYASASHAYTSFAQPPNQSSGSAQMPLSNSLQANSLMLGNGQQHQQQIGVQADQSLSMAGSQLHPSVVHAGAGQSPSHQSIERNTQQPAGSGSIDFHQVLDAFVRSSGFAPSGDPDAAASGANKQDDSSTVFSFKKLLTYPIYMSTEEKPTELLANAAPSSYARLSAPLMRRNVVDQPNQLRRASIAQQTPALQQQQQPIQAITSSINMSPIVSNSEQFLEQTNTLFQQSPKQQAQVSTKFQPIEQTNYQSHHLNQQQQQQHNSELQQQSQQQPTK